MLVLDMMLSLTQILIRPEVETSLLKLAEVDAMRKRPAFSISAVPVFHIVVRPANIINRCADYVNSRIEDLDAYDPLLLRREGHWLYPILQPSRILVPGMIDPYPKTAPAKSRDFWLLDLAPMSGIRHLLGQRSVVSCFPNCLYATPVDLAGSSAAFLHTHATSCHCFRSAHTSNIVFVKGGS